MARLNKERQQELEPDRLKYAQNELEKLGIKITYQSKTHIEFDFKEHIVRLYPYSGWHTGKSIVDGRGLQKLINQIKQK